MIGHQIVVTVLSIGRDQVRLGIEAPADVEVHREEVYRSIQQANRLAAEAGGDVGQLASVLPGARAVPAGPAPSPAAGVGATAQGAEAPGSSEGSPAPSGTATP